MKNIQPQALFANADQMLSAANAEMNRAAEDAVTHLICHNSRQSIFDYLRGFLIRSAVEPVEPLTISGLLEQCAAIDSRFRELDVSQIHCRFENRDSDYCLDLKTVEDCLHIAMQTKALVGQ